ncbi:MAG: hypothetical protein EOP01_05610 [Propionibacteriaceae bacterium]|nr:MAG: hypothetical protein EOP01_05610 [Propionibacteriaceae bacterium]
MLRRPVPIRPPVMPRVRFTIDDQLSAYLDAIGEQVRAFARAASVPVWLMGDEPEPVDRGRTPDGSYVLTDVQLDETTRHRARGWGKDRPPPADAPDGRPGWLEPELWDRLEQARTADPAPFRRLYLNDVIRPAGWERLCVPRVDDPTG